jgi:hypothetical protein
MVEWAHRETSPEAVFLVHPMYSQFRAVLKRPLFFTYKDPGTIFWDQRYAPSVIERLDALGVDMLAPRSEQEDITDELIRRFNALRDADIVRLKQDYRIDYWVAGNGVPTRFPAVYRNEIFQVLDVR